MLGSEVLFSTLGIIMFCTVSCSFTSCPVIRSKFKFPHPESFKSHQIVIPGPPPPPPPPLLLSDQVTRGYYLSVMRIRESYTYQSNDNCCNGAQLEQLACFVAALARSCYLDSSSGG